jgi:hypothetical protein
MKPDSSTDQLAKRLNRYMSESKLLMIRNMSYGASGICLVIVGLLLQPHTMTTPLLVSIFCASVAMPLWACLGVIYETYIFLGTRGHAHARSTFAQSIIAITAMLGILGLIAAIFSLIYYLSQMAAYSFCGAILLAAIIFSAFYKHIASWYFSVPDNSIDASDS